MSFHIKINDTVKVLAGKNKGKTGKVIQVLPKDHQVVVENVNKMFKHMRSPRRGEKGQRIEFAAPLPISKVMIVCPKCGKTARMNLVREGAKRSRVCKKCKVEID
ncbi:MAG: 50S ribosomal protein L24 [Candidatus Komeilibacteria bacterium RIFCSPLOWO2_01_FULL_52_15]|uniref:Large ribosomal subunit protein uL24 n=2 Tax=Candidatus Komeiliibacteriota TaxID=1817908 RepID=A0A1G2BPH3_9BACT|nr:MAG: 50S ribosomal protein L24 [Candidatus Komeilibacteria bacterium RIFCSPHIGHO2_01_FULL_52_14]OGY91012.1 MAG: 50S ribosomal protein L24 [Candidatus Komeilibacteria bacterium RIFCSPLOWO2_01_FULL_52_15]